MKFCPVVPEICHGHVHVAKKERRIIIIIRNGAKTISFQTMFGRLNNSINLLFSFLSLRRERVHGRSQELLDRIS
jgi:hypothetical protein